MSERELLDKTGLLVMTYSDLKRERERHRRMMDEIFDVDDEWIVIKKDSNGRHVGYDIELSRISCPASLLHWVHHLTPKEWVTTEIIREFIERVYDAKGWDIHGPLSYE